MVHLIFRDRKPNAMERTLFERRPPEPHKKNNELETKSTRGRNGTKSDVIMNVRSPRKGGGVCEFNGLGGG